MTPIAIWHAARLSRKHQHHHHHHYTACAAKATVLLCDAVEVLICNMVQACKTCHATAGSTRSTGMFLLMLHKAGLSKRVPRATW
jgi:hypothetical protein